MGRLEEPNFSTESAKNRPWTRYYRLRNLRAPRLMSRIYRALRAAEGVIHGQGTLSDTSGGKYYRACVAHPLIVRDHDGKPRLSSISTILCFENFKEASLYFDRVIPLNMGRMRGDSTVGDILVGYPEEIPSAALSHLIDGIEGNTVTYSHATRVMEFTANRWVEFAKEVEPYARLWSSDPRRPDDDDVRNQYQKLQESYFADASISGVAPIREVFRRYAKGVGFDHFCVSVPSAIGSGGSQCDPSITLS